ncbi:MAG: hypothetical protein O6765_03535 [Gammaproteobacteria bacterium]|nr:hypothetical protein [Gammaproteobacteria bacterium]
MTALVGPAGLHMLEDAGDGVGVSHLGDDPNQCTAARALSRVV